LEIATVTQGGSRKKKWVWHYYHFYIWYEQGSHRARSRFEWVPRDKKFVPGSLADLIGADAKIATLRALPPG
jgi:hypothetical protein